MNNLPIGIIDIGSNSVRFVVYDPPYLAKAPISMRKSNAGWAGG